MSLNKLDENQIDSIIKVFDVISRHKTIEKNSYDNMKIDKDLYVNLIPDESCMLSIFQEKAKQKLYFLVGRKGIGKTTVFNRVRTECIESFFIKKELEYLKQNRMILPVYMEARNLFSRVAEKINNEVDELQQIEQLIRNLNIEFLEEIGKSYEDIRNLGIIDNFILQKVQNIIDGCVSEISTRKDIFGKDIIEKSKDLLIDLKNSLKKISFDKQSEKLFLKIKTKTNFVNICKNFFQIDIITRMLEKLKNLKEFPLNYMHFLVDDFSELSFLNQKIFIDGLIETLIENKNYKDIIFCFACYPYLYYDGSSITKQYSEIIELDWCKYNKNINTFEEQVNKNIRNLTKLVFKGLNIRLPQIFRIEKDLNIIFEDLPNFLKELFFMTMNNPRLIGLILNYSECKQYLKNRHKISISVIQRAIVFIFKELIYKDYFINISNIHISNFYFSKDKIIFDKLLFDYLIKIIKTKPKDYYSRFFIIDEEIIQDEFDLLKRLELMGFLYRIGVQSTNNRIINYPWNKEKQAKIGIYCLNYGACSYYKLNLEFEKDIEFLIQNRGIYDITETLLDFIKETEHYKCQNPNCGKFWPNIKKFELKNGFLCDNCNSNEIDKIGMTELTKLYNKGEIPEELKKEKDIFESLMKNLNQFQIKLIHTLYIHKEDNKGWMTTDEIGITKRLFPFPLHHISIIRFIRSIKDLDHGKFLIDEIQKGIQSFRISNLGIRFEKYYSWKLNIYN